MLYKVERSLFDTLRPPLRGGLFVLPLYKPTSPGQTNGIHKFAERDGDDGAYQAVFEG